MGALRKVNKLRNELSHRLDNKPTNESLFEFLVSMSAVHPVSVTKRRGLPIKSLRSYREFAAHFNGNGAKDLEEFVFVSLLLLRAKLLPRIESLGS